MYVAHDIAHIAVCNITEKFILSGNNDQVDLPGKVTEHREMAKKKDKVYKSCIYMYRAEKRKQKNTLARNGLGSFGTCTYLQVNSETGYA